MDSGVGGLSVMAAIRARLPDADLIYAGDTAWVPYGGRGEVFIRERTLALGRWLVGLGARGLVVACNTATAAGVPALRDAVALPVIGMEPAVKPAAAATRRGVVGVLATTGTLGSARFAALLDRFAEGVTVLTEPCPDLVERVERGELEGPATEAAVAAHLAPLLAAGADVVVLGCTHFPFLRPVIQRLAGPGVTLIDTGEAVARQVLRRLGPVEGGGGEAFHCTGDPGEFDRALAVLWPGASAAGRLEL